MGGDISRIRNEFGEYIVILSKIAWLQVTVDNKERNIECWLERQVQKNEKICNCHC